MYVCIIILFLYYSFYYYCAGTRVSLYSMCQRRLYLSSSFTNYPNSDTQSLAKCCHANRYVYMCTIQFCNQYNYLAVCFYNVFSDHYVNLDIIFISNYIVVTIIIRKAVARNCSKFLILQCLVFSDHNVNGKSYL